MQYSPVICHSFTKMLVQFVVGAGLLVFADLILDPGAVLMTFWTWNDPGVYYSIPFTNYLGWGFSSIIGGLMFYYLIPKKALDNLSLFSVLTLSLGNAFWIGVTLRVGYWIPFALGIMLQFFMIYAAGRKLD